MLGYLKTINADRGFCFLRSEDNKDVFAHVHELRNVEWEDLCTEFAQAKDNGRRVEVEFDLYEGERGPVAKNIHVINDTNGETTNA